VHHPCTGTGAIALAIASEVPGVRVVAGDRDPRAIALARRNTSEVAGDLARKATVEVVASDVFDGFPPEWRGSVDVVVCNPPYLPERDATTWEPEVADHDPITALVGGPDGHEVVDAVLAQARDWLRPGGTVVVEIDDRRGAEAADVATALGYVDVHLVADLTGRDRAVAAVHPSGETPGETK
jgi:release factor glutamine methyltransferase